MSESNIKEQKSLYAKRYPLNAAIFCILIFGFCSFCFAQEDFVYDAKGKRNPFIPLVTSDGRLLKLDKEKTQADLSVEGIIFDKQGRSYAIVNGSIFGIGDTVQDYKILKIQDKKVSFIKEGIIREVEIEKEEE